MAAAYTAPPSLSRTQSTSLMVGVAFLLLLVAGAFVERAMGYDGWGQFFHSYLLAFVFWVGISIGSLAILMLQHLTGGAWGLVMRRVLEAGSRTLPLMALLFVPVVLGLGYNYGWMHPLQHYQGEPLEVVEHKIPYYLNWKLFIVRAVIYFAIWLLLMFFLNAWSLEQDRTADRRYKRQMRMISGIGLVLLIFAVTFASFDWVMSLDPTWASTIFGLLFVASWALTALAFGIAVMAMLANHAPMEGIVQPRHFHDWGKLLLAFVMLWAYFSFSQYLIIWSGNLPEEARWYLYRTEGGWGIVAVVVIILHFMFPFLMLLSRDLKRNARTLALVAIGVLVMRLVDLFWLIEPVFHPFHLHLSWMDVAAPVALGGIWLWFFTGQLKQRPLLPINDPDLESATAHVHGGH
ncbi:MAG: hypothetical protein WBP93_06840 [Pyrinomonadaceae bacterium]